MRVRKASAIAQSARIISMFVQTAEHPSYGEMLAESFKVLHNGRKGTSTRALLKHMQEAYQLGDIKVGAQTHVTVLTCVNVLRSMWRISPVKHSRSPWSRAKSCANRALLVSPAVLPSRHRRRKPRTMATRKTVSVPIDIRMRIIMQCCR